MKPRIEIPTGDCMSQGKTLSQTDVAAAPLVDPNRL